MFKCQIDFKNNVGLSFDYSILYIEISKVQKKHCSIGRFVLRIICLCTSFKRLSSVTLIFVNLMMSKFFLLNIYQQVNFTRYHLDTFRRQIGVSSVNLKSIPPRDQVIVAESSLARLRSVLCTPSEVIDDGVVLRETGIYI